MALHKQEAHRPGALKQTNKSHKTGRHRSKGSISIATKGKVNVKEISKKKKAELNKEQRRLQALQIRRNKRDEVLSKKRSIGGLNDAPFLVTIVPLNELINVNDVLKLLETCDEEANVVASQGKVTHITIPRFKQRFSFLIPDISNYLAILDALKVSDTVLFVVSANAGIGFGAELVDNFGRKILMAAFAQGLPTPVVAVTDLNDLPMKKQSEQKQSIQKMVSKWLPEEKIVCLGKQSEAVNVLRKIGCQKRRSILYKERRPHLIAESCEFKADGEKDVGTLKITGYLRGAPLNVNGLAYLPGLGAFQMSRIDAANDPFVIDKKKNQIQDELMEEGLVRVLQTADPNLQESLQSENVPDPMDAEQTWPTEEEIKMAQEEQFKVPKKVKKVPKGWSDYQAAWIPDEDAEELSDLSESEGEHDEAMEAASQSESEADNEEFETMTESEVAVNDLQYDQQIDLMAEQQDLDKMKEAKLDKMFPDEIDTPQDVSARERFQKYRGLESFRTSPWDPKENLPLDYARIFQFENFDRTKKRVLKQQQEADGAQLGWFITVHVANVPTWGWNAFLSTNPMLTLVGLLPHENKMSVLNAVLKRVGGYEEPIRSKERLVFQCGFRRFIVNPIFSQHTNGRKHKFERFFQTDSASVTTFFAPIQFPPVPILCFKEINGCLELVATGNLLSCNPDRIVAKRVVLSGHPFKVHKKSAVIRFMFFNREDITYFKPCKLRTKYGRTGHIKEPLGTHGHMKCIFDGQLKSQDTILLNLYKRVFPKWTYEECIVTSQST